MKFKIDENLPTELVDDLRAAGHDAHTVPDEGLTGAPDSVVMDRGIADPRSYAPERYAGIVLFRSAASGRGAVLAFVRRHLASLLQADLAGHLLVVSERGIRMR